MSTHDLIELYVATVEIDSQTGVPLGISNPLTLDVIKRSISGVPSPVLNAALILCHGGPPRQGTQRKTIGVYDWAPDAHLNRGSFGSHGRDGRDYKLRADGSPKYYIRMTFNGSEDIAGAYSCAHGGTFNTEIPSHYTACLSVFQDCLFISWFLWKLLPIHLQPLCPIPRQNPPHAVTKVGVLSKCLCGNLLHGKRLYCATCDPDDLGMQKYLR